MTPKTVQSWIGNVAIQNSTFRKPCSDGLVTLWEEVHGRQES